MTDKESKTKTKLIFGKNKDIEWKEIEQIYDDLGKLTSGSNITPVLKKMKKLTDKYL